MSVFRRTLVAVAAVVVAALAVGVVLYIQSRPEPVTAADVDRAVVACHKAVEGRLVSGAAATYSAEHPDVFGESFRITGTVEVDDKGTPDWSTYVCDGKRPDGGFAVTGLQLIPR